MVTFTNGLRVGVSTGSLYLHRGILHERAASIADTSHSSLYPSTPMEVHVSSLDQLEGPQYDHLGFMLVSYANSIVPRWISMHAPTGVSLSELDWAIPRILHLSELARAKTIVLHPQEGLDPYELVQRLGGKGAVENMDSTRPGQTIEELAPYFDAGFGLTLDVNHAHEVGGPALVAEFIRRGGRLIKNYHISAHDGINMPHELYSLHPDLADQLEVLRSLPPRVMIHEGMVPKGMDPNKSICAELDLLNQHLPFQSPSCTACDI